MSELEELIKKSAKLNRTEMGALRSRLSEWIREEIDREEATNTKKLKAFAKAVREAGILKELKTVAVAKQVKLHARIYWEYGGNLHELESKNDVGTSVQLVGRQDDILDALFRVQANQLQGRAFKALKKVVALAKKYGVDDLHYDKAVEFLWTE
jgi:flagellar biosynthesis regulator FlbT